MYDAPGVGLAGPQVGLSLRLFVFDDGETGPRSWRTRSCVDAEGEIIEEEGCLSIPGPFHPTRRGRDRTCRGQDLDGRAVRDHRRGTARADLPARDRSPRRHALHRPARRGGPARGPGASSAGSSSGSTEPPSQRRHDAGDERGDPRACASVFLGNDPGRCRPSRRSRADADRRGARSVTTTRPPRRPRRSTLTADPGRRRRARRSGSRWRDRDGARRARIATRSRDCAPDVSSSSPTASSCRARCWIAAARRREPALLAAAALARRRARCSTRSSRATR